MSVAAQSGRMMFSVFGNGEYTVFSKEPEELEGTLVQIGEGEQSFRAGILPPFRGVDEGLVGDYLNDSLTGLPADRDFSLDNYSARLQLDYVAPPTLGVSVGGVYGSGITGGVGLFFSDMLGNHNLTIIAQANGSFKDIGAQVGYLNQGHRFNYGGLVGHIPILFGSSFVGIERDPETGQLVQTISQLRQRIFIDQIQGVASYPFTTTRRLELTAGFTRYGFDYELEKFFFTSFGVRREKTNLNSLEPDPEYFAQVGLAFVSDYSFFAFTSPVRGGRSRFEVTPFIGSMQYVRALVDFRRYFFLSPVTLAVRGMHIGNYGATDSDDRIFTREYLGYANGRGFIRGYSFSSFDDLGECTATAEGLCAEQERLLGTRIATASVELRIPLLGTSTFGLLNFPYLPTEISLFVDAGVAWTADDLPKLDFVTTPTPDRVPVFSTGISTRFNMFGYTVIEIFYAKPYQRPGKGAHFGFQIIPGW